MNPPAVCSWRMQADAEQPTLVVHSWDEQGAPVWIPTFCVIPALPGQAQWLSCALPSHSSSHSPSSSPVRNKPQHVSPQPGGEERLRAEARQSRSQMSSQHPWEGNVQPLFRYRGPQCPILNSYCWFFELGTSLRNESFQRKRILNKETITSCLYVQKTGC